MNKPLQRIALAMMAMVVLLFGNATYVQVVRADALRDSPGNSRTLFDEYSRQRGQIIAGGRSLASSVVTQDRLKYLRTYTEGKVFAPVTGYYSFVYGANGVERTSTDMLDGTDSRLTFTKVTDLVAGRESRGGNVELNINPVMQRIAYTELASKGFQGSVVALNPKTGAILAMANAPSYDPNQLASHDSGQLAKAWNGLSATPGDPMTNRAVSEIYPPGSTFKLITTAAALNNGYDRNTAVTAAPAIRLPGTNTLLPNFEGNNCGSGGIASLQEALARSCNTAFAQVAGDVGADGMRETAAAFGFGQDLKMPMDVAKSDLGPMADQPSLFQSGIGQRDVRVTPLQNAMVAAAIANNGVLMKPELVKDVKAPDMSVLEQSEPQRMSQAVSPAVARTIRDMMLQAEARTQGSGKIAGVQIASKTGTAQHGDADDRPHGWYVAFAPANDPKVAVAVIVENGGDEGAEATGGSIAAPIGRQVIRAGLQAGG